MRAHAGRGGETTPAVSCKLLVAEEAYSCSEIIKPGPAVAAPAVEQFLSFDVKQIFGHIAEYKFERKDKTSRNNLYGAWWSVDVEGMEENWAAIFFV